MIYYYINEEDFTSVEQDKKKVLIRNYSENVARIVPRNKCVCEYRFIYNGNSLPLHTLSSINFIKVDKRKNIIYIHTSNDSEFRINLEDKNNIVEVTIISTEKGIGIVVDYKK